MGDGFKDTKGALNMTCFFCGGDMEKKATTYTVEIEGVLYIVKNVPSNVCKQCGEVAFDDDVFKRLHKIIQEMKSSTSEMVVSTYKAA